MKVLHVITGLEVGGAESMLAKLLARMDRDRFDPVVVSLMSGGSNRETIEDLGIPVHDAGMKPGLPNPAVLWRLAGLARSLRPDLIQGWMYHGNLAAAWMKTWTPGPTQMIWNIRHSVDDIRREKPLTRTVIKLGARLDGAARTVLVNSQASLDQHAGLGYDRGRLTLVPNGFDINRFRPDPRARHRIRLELEIPEDLPLVGMVARRHPMKGHGDFLRMALLVQRKLGMAHFLMAGRGVTTEDAELGGLALTEPLAGSVHLVGPRSDTPAIMAALDVLVVPSVFGEGFPNVLGEAMACGVPCVATAVGDSGAVIGDCGHLVPPGRPEALAGGVLDLLDRPEDARLELSVRCRHRIADHYDLEAIARRYEEIYKSS